MQFQIGEKVVHRAYGVGEILQIDEKILSGRAETYYVVKIRDLTVWVPMNGGGEGSLRSTTPASEFNSLFEILSNSGEDLASDRLERRTELIDRLRHGSLESICRVIRDLSSYRRTNKLNDHDVSVLERAKNLLLDEWQLALSVPLSEARNQLALYLGDGKTVKD
jgi:RNA polymerase-interacting CarD/CdnL/TRCF family regulator